MKRTVFVTALASLYICTPIFAADYLTEAEFGTKIVGKTLSSKTQKGKNFTSKFASGGSGSMKIKGIKASSISWSYSGDTLCWEAYKTKECDKVEMDGDSSAKFIDAQSGKLNNTYSVR